MGQNHRTIPCEACEGSGEHVLGHPSGDPQRERSVPCPECVGTRIQACAACNRQPATTYAWSRERPKSSAAVREPLCDACVVEALATGVLVAIDPSTEATERGGGLVAAVGTSEVSAQRGVDCVTVASIGDYQAWDTRLALEVAAAIVRGAAFVAAGDTASKAAS